jgi:hypothetical protein
LLRHTRHFAQLPNFEVRSTTQLFVTSKQVPYLVGWVLEPASLVVILTSNSSTRVKVTKRCSGGNKVHLPRKRRIANRKHSILSFNGLICQQWKLDQLLSRLFHIRFSWLLCGDFWVLRSMLGSNCPGYWYTGLTWSAGHQPINPCRQCLRRFLCRTSWGPCEPMVTERMNFLQAELRYTSGTHLQISSANRLTPCMHRKWWLFVYSDWASFLQCS